MSQIKTAISINDIIFEEANRLARKARISRSHLFELAVAEWLEKEKKKAITEQINRAVEKDHVTSVESRHRRELGRHQKKLMRGEW